MTDCCTYYLAQVKTKAGTWIEIGISSKSLDEVNGKLAKYLIGKAGSETRVVQRSIKEDKSIGKKVPGCC